MTIENLPKRFYRLIYFSPRPEDDERVCVALVTWDEGRTHYLFDERARKARGLSREYSAESILFVLERLHEKAEEIALTGAVPEFSPQFRVSEPRVLLKPVTAEVRNLLLLTYLSPQKGHRHRSIENQIGLGRKIEQFLGRLLVPRKLIIRRPSTEQLLGADIVRQMPEELVPKPVARVINLGGTLLLIDGVDVHVSSDSLVDHVGRVVHTYWQYKKVKDVLERGKIKVKSAALVFDGEGGEQVDESFIWRREYAKEQFKKDADIIINPAVAAEEEDLRHLLRAADH